MLLNLCCRAAYSRSGVLLGGRFLGGGLLCGRGLVGGGVLFRGRGLLGRGVLCGGRGLCLGGCLRLGGGFLLRRGLLRVADGEDAQQRQRLAVTVATAIIVPAALFEDDALFAARLGDDLGRHGQIGRAACRERGCQYV